MLSVCLLIWLIRLTSIFLALVRAVFTMWHMRSALIRTFGCQAKSGRSLSLPAVFALDNATYSAPGFRDSKALVPGLMMMYRYMFPFPIFIPARGKCSLWVIPCLVNNCLRRTPSDSLNYFEIQESWNYLFSMLLSNQVLQLCQI